MTRRRVIIALVLLVLAIGLVWKIAHRPAASFIASHFGDRLLRLGDGKFTDPRHFVEMRLADLALLSVQICAVTVVCALILPLLNRRLPPRYHWIAGGLTGFVALNIVAALASQTALFWCALYTGKNDTHNYTQYQIKRQLLAECTAPAQAILIGNSQTRAQIDRTILNDRLGHRLWTTELHFPGSRPYDIDLSFLKLPKAPLRFAICYVTEGYFFSGTDSDGLIYFQDWRRLPMFYRLSGGELSPGPNFLYGLLGDAIPLFRLREPLASRLFGFHLLNLPQEHYNGALDTNLVKRAEQAAKGYHGGKLVEFQEKCFVALAQSCRARGAKLIVCAGQMNPILAQVLDPSLRPEMLRFLRQLARDDSNVVLLDESDLPRQTADDYEDLSHVNEAARARFSAYIAGVLAKLLANDTVATK